MTEPLNPFSGKVALVTGAGRGAGRLSALTLAGRGMIVAANDISPVNVEMLVDEIWAAGGQAKAYIHDVAKKVDVQAMINNVMDDFGQIDLLVNNANVKISTPLLSIDEWDLHRIFEVNVIGTLLMMQSAGRVMRSQSGGVVINLVKTGLNAPPTFITSRVGIDAMTDQVNKEFNEYGIHVFALADENPLDAILAICKQIWSSTP